jgi:hypothetical protein
VTLPTASNTSVPLETCYQSGGRVPTVLVDLQGAQHQRLIPPTRLLRLVHEGLLQVRKRTGQTRRSFDRLIESLPTVTCK